jgi:hypothetical protein
MPLQAPAPSRPLDPARHSNRGAQAIPTPRSLVARFANRFAQRPPALLHRARFLLDRWRPQGDTQVSTPAAFREFAPICDVFPLWLGGMTQEEAGLALTLVAMA